MIKATLQVEAAASRVLPTHPRIGAARCRFGDGDVGGMMKWVLPVGSSALLSFALFPVVVQKGLLSGFASLDPGDLGGEKIGELAEFGRSGQ